MSNEKRFKGVAKDFINAMKLQFIGKGADPNEIFVQDLYNYEPRNTQTLFNRLFKKDGSNLLTNLSTEDRKILETILRVYNEHISTKRELLTQSRQLFETDIVQRVIDVMIDDGFNSFNDEKEEFKIEYDLDEEDKENLGEEYQQQVQNIIDEFVEKFHIKSRIPEIIPDLLRDGEYAWGVLFEEGKGITDIIDDMDVINLLPFYEGDKPVFVIKQDSFEDDYMVGNKNVLTQNKLQPPKIYKADNILFFRLKGPRKKRINLSLFYDNDFRKEFYERTNIRLPKYIRIPLPIYYGAIKNLNRLQLMENVSTVLDVSEILKPEIVTVTVPSTTNPQEAQQIIRDYERQLNDNSALADSDQLDISTLGAQANRRKVLPQWADSKGTITQTGIGNQPKSDNAWNSVNNLRNLIALSIGIPPFYINITETPMEKSQTIKLYSMYTRKLTSLQKSVADPIKDLIVLHCSKKGVNINKENINIKFKAITSGDSLDDTDIMVGTISGINDLYKGLEEIVSSDQNNFVLDDQKFKEFFDNRTGDLLGVSDLIRISDNKFNKQEYGDEEGFEPTEGPSGPSNDVSSNIDTGFEELQNEGGSDEDVYQEFADTTDNIELEEPQTITTES